MDHFRSPQAANPTTLSISSPRSLRPREDPQPVTPQFYPTPHTPQTFYAPPYSPESRTEDELDQSPPVDYVERGRTEQDPPQGTSSGRRIGLMSGLTNGLRRLPGAFVKHHSRESLHAQYQAEAEAVAARYSRRYSSRTTSQVMTDAPGTVVESESEPLPTVHEVFEDGTTVVPQQGFRPMPQPQIRPAYSDSQLTSEYSRTESINLPLPPSDTWAYYWAIVLLLIYHIRKLPWSDTRIVDDYVPARDGRGGYGAQKRTVSWYQPKRRAGDVEKVTSISPPRLYVVPATPQSGTHLSSMSREFPPEPAPVIVPSPYSDATTAIRPTRTPLTVTSMGMSMMSPGASSHGLSRQELSYSWYSSSPQQFPWQHPYSHESEMSTPQAHMESGYFGRRY